MAGDNPLQKLRRLIGSGAEECPIDAQGRVRIPQHLRDYAGLTGPETAEALHLSPRTVNRQWTAARTWLHRELGGGGTPE